VYASNISSGTISVISSTNGVTNNFSGVSNDASTEMTASGDGYIFYSRNGGSFFIRLSSTGVKTQLTCPIPGGNCGIPTYAGGTVWTADYSGGGGFMATNPLTMATTFYTGTSAQAVTKFVYDGSNLVGIGSTVDGYLVSLGAVVSTYPYSASLNHVQTDCVLASYGNVWCAENSGNVVNVFSGTGYQNGDAAANPTGFANAGQGLPNAQSGSDIVATNQTVILKTTQPNVTTFSNANGIAVTGGPFNPPQKTLAQLVLISPHVGDVYSCSNCTNTYDLFVGTGTGQNQFREVGSSNQGVH
jgi:hypothetical protein